jgi:hypoxanthine phosphoribosyltransferase
MEKYNINDDIDFVMIPEEKLDSIVQKIADDIDRDYPDPHKKLLLLGILKGSVVFMGDLMKKIKRPVEIDFMKVSSYANGTSSSKTVNIVLDLHRADIADLDILIIEDIIDSGRTMLYLTKYLKNKGAASVKCAALLDKPSRREVEYDADYIGCEIEDKFVVGYGLDFAEKYRALPYVGVLKDELTK